MTSFSFQPIDTIAHFHSLQDWLWKNIDIEEYISTTFALKLSCTCVEYENKKSEHITHILKSVHSLPVCFWIDFKILLLVYKAPNGLGPNSLSDLLLSYVPSSILKLTFYFRYYSLQYISSLLVYYFIFISDFLLTPHLSFLVLLTSVYYFCLLAFCYRLVSTNFSIIVLILPLWCFDIDVLIAFPQFLFLLTDLFIYCF